MTDLRQSPQWATYLKSLGWTVERINKTNYAVRNIPLYGRVVKIQRPDKIDTETIQILKEKYRPRKIYLEPLTSFGSRHTSSYQFLPTKTIQIDLTKSEQQLLAEMNQTTRRNIKKFSIFNFQFSISDNIELFIRLWHRWHRRRLLFWSQAKEIRELYKAFGKNAHLLFAITSQVTERAPGTVVAVLLTVDYNLISYYMYAAASNEGKKLAAPTLLTWEAIKLAKKKGCKVFDFDGIYDKRFPIKTWQGFTRFKQGFGGTEIFFPGCFLI